MVQIKCGSRFPGLQGKEECCFSIKRRPQKCESYKSFLFPLTFIHGHEILENIKYERLDRLLKTKSVPKYNVLIEIYMVNYATKSNRF